MLLKRMVSAAILAFTLAACASFGRSPDATLRLDRESIAAVDRITEARCERSRACGADVDASCQERLRVQTATELGLSRCASAIDELVLRDCVRRIRGHACTEPLESVTRLHSCTVGTLCAPGPEEGTV